MSKDTPLLPLEYCRIDRAARLLGCEEVDILHWGATAKISLRIHADHVPLGTPPDNEEVTSKKVVMYTGEKRLEVASVFRGGGVFKISKYASASFDSLRCEGASDELFSLGRAILKGLWRVPHQTIEKIYHGTSGYIFPVYEHYCRRGSCQPEGVRTFTGFGYGCEQQDFARARNNLIVMSDDLALLYKHIASGQPIPDKKGQASADIEVVASAEEIKPRVTANQSKAIVELLMAHGFTDKDFQGSIEALKQKIACKKLSGTLADVDKNTLAAWLRKAGVRQ